MRILLSSLLLVFFNCYSQNNIIFSIKEDQGLVDYDKTKILNPDYLDPFFEKLHKLHTDKKGTLSILHIGDSHVQGDYVTHQIRQNFQLEFGNAGRGFIFPNRIAETNESYSYFSESAFKWEAKRLVFPDQPLPIGLAGISVRTEDEHASFRVHVKNYPGLDYSFSDMRLYFQKEPRSFNVAICDTLNRDLAFAGTFSPSHFTHTAQVNLPYPTNSVDIRLLKSLQAQNRFTLFGMSFTNGKSGVLYHSIGVNGAKYKHYLQAEYFNEQTTSLNPSLIILALGTNEALEYPYSDPKFEEYVDTMFARLRSANPDATFLIFIPGENYRQKTRKNPGVTIIRDKLIKYAESNNISYFDLYAAGGDVRFASRWRKEELLRDDGVHFTRKGYELQGNMFYLAFINAYNHYVSNRYK